MKLFLVRHGQTDYNVKHILNDNPLEKVHLNETGQQQAKQAAEKLKNSQFEIIFVSEFCRTQETAEIINQYHHLEVKVEPRLNEIKTGFNNQSIAEYEKAYQNYEISADPKAEIWHLRFNGGESFTEVQNRIFSFLDELKKQSFQAVLIVTHEATIKFIKGYVENLPTQDILYSQAVVNGGILELEI